MKIALSETEKTFILFIYLTVNILIYKMFRDLKKKNSKLKSRVLELEEENRLLRDERNETRIDFRI